MHASRALMIVFALATLACGGDDDAAPRGAAGRGPFGAPAAPASAAPPPTSTVGGRHHVLGTLDRDPIDHVAQLAGSTPPTQTTTTTMGSAAEPEERHLGAELATAIGSPATCIDVATARTLHGHLSVQVSAMVTPSGNVTRATASGGSLPEAALACIQSRVMAAHLAAPVDGAPRSVSTSLSFDITTTDDVTTRVTPEWHQPGAVAQPGVVLSAGGTEGRPQGTVNPDTVLPAVGATGRPDGTVSPDIVLPARGGSGTLWPSGAPPPPPT